jgi:predicted Zn-dependent protease with MMP-like domain
MREPEADDLLERIYDALDAGDPAEAEGLAAAALAGPGDDDPVLRLLRGVALLELDRPADAARELERAVELDPDDAEARANWALALFRCCRFDDAAREARAAVTGSADLPDAHAVLAMCLERSGDFDGADRHTIEASRIDPERFPAPARMPRAQFAAEVLAAGRRLPAAFRAHLDRVAVTVEDLPSEAILRDTDPPLDPELLGLFVGHALTESALDGAGELPPRILLFQRNLERFASDPQELRDEIAVTLYHELGHYLGLDEDDLDALDLA